MAQFELVSPYSPTGDQPAAIKQLVDGLKAGVHEQTLLGVTGSGKTFTMANIIEQVQRPTLVLVHNKTLAAQLYSEFREFFPHNEVHYFVSYFDYYQPEAYIASTDTYIEKDSAINEEIDRLRHGATEALLTRRDTIVVSSVSCIYGIGSPAHYMEMSLPLWKGEHGWFAKDGGREVAVEQLAFLRELIGMQYHRNDLAFERGNFRVMGDTVDLYPANGEWAYRFEFGFDGLEQVKIVEPLTFAVREKPTHVHIFPNTHYATPQNQLEKALVTIRAEFEERLKYFEDNQKYLEAQRLSQRTKYDLEMLESTGFVKGIENYSRHLDGRRPGEPPATLLDFFPKDFLLIVDESHMTLRQIDGMYGGDRSRKESLVKYGFRLPSALDNRPLTRAEFDQHISQAIYVSATPAEYELAHSPKPAEQVIRPTGLLDPEIEVRSSEGQIDDLVEEINQRIGRGQRTLVTTLTKRMAEDLSEHLGELGLKVAYIHSDVDTLERTRILHDLRSGVYDVLVGINLLREGLDLPEVSLVAILDADKSGFLRSVPALIQTIGRAARHVEGKVIMYADEISSNMAQAIEETERRRAIQQAYNAKHHITPQSIVKEVKEGLEAVINKGPEENKLDLKRVPKEEIPQLIKQLTSEMELAAANLDFEHAAALRDEIVRIKKEAL